MLEREYPFIRRCFLTNTTICPKNPKVKRNQAFVAMPFRSEYDDVYESIASTLDQLEIPVIRADERFAPSALSCSICELIQQSRYVICEVSESNPNVFFELGLAYGLSRTVILLYQASGDKIPSDLSGIIRIQYDRSHLSKFREELEHKLSLLKNHDYEFDAYLSNYKYRVLDLNLDLHVDSSRGDTSTKYDITVQCICPDSGQSPVSFVMPYHDTPNIPTELDEFNLTATILQDFQPLGIEWILKSRVWKRFCISLPPIRYEEQCRFSVSLEEKGLFYRDEPFDFYDVQIRYPTESAVLAFHFPPTWFPTDISVVDADSGHTAQCVTRKELERHHDRNSLLVQMSRPTVGATYLLNWTWSD
jgi:hypothetical protein